MSAELGGGQESVSGVLTAIGSPGRFYSLFGLLTVVWLLLRWFLRRRFGRESYEARVRSAEHGVLALLLLSMLGLAVLQIFLRNVFHTGLIWIEPLARHLVLWIGFGGAVVATGRLRHIHMDVIGRLLPESQRLWLLRFTIAVAAIVCAALARAAWLYLVAEAEFGSRGVLGIPTWELTAIIFIGFAAMSARFVSRALESRETLAAMMREGESEEMMTLLMRNGPTEQMTGAASSAERNAGVPAAVDPGGENDRG
jgi:TRAP-type C4-dicarboxylate transport system permease small subunit